jgi:hypothetical protein
MVVAITAALTLWRHTMMATGYALFLLPLFGALGCGLGFAGGTLLERHIRAGNGKTG